MTAVPGTPAWTHRFAPASLKPTGTVYGQGSLGDDACWFSALHAEDVAGAVRCLGKPWRALDGTLHEME